MFNFRATAGDVNTSLSISPLTLRLKKAEWRCHRILHFRMSQKNVTVAHMRSRGYSTAEVVYDRIMTDREIIKSECYLYLISL